MHEASVVATELARNLKHWTRNWRVRIMLFAVVFLLASSLVVYRFSPKYDQTDCAFRIPESAIAPETQGDASRLDNCVSLEKASTNSERTLGLSGRQSMDSNKGMLFDFIQAGEYCMWMKDMNFSLDMIWLNEDKEIIYMIEGVTPETYPKSFCGPDNSRYVIEVNQGIVKAADLHIGQRIRF